MGSLASAGLTPDPALAHGLFPTPSPHLPQWGRLRPMVEVRPAMAEGNLRLLLDLKVLAIPLADGGEGTTKASVEEQLGWLAEARAVLEMGRLATAAKRM